MLQSTQVSFNKGAYGAPKGVVLEQEKWASFIGKVEKYKIVLAIEAMLFKSTKSPTFDCGVDLDVTYCSKISMYPFDTSLIYELGITNGTIAEISVRTVTKTERLHFSLTTSETLKYPVQSLVKMSWVAPPYNSRAEEVSYPTLTRLGNNILADQKVYGTVEIVYKTIEHSALIYVPARESIENRFQSVVWCRWGGGVKMLELSEPPNAESSLEQNETCEGRYSNFSVIHKDHFKPPYAEEADKDIFSDYCSGLRLL